MKHIYYIVITLACLTTSIVITLGHRLPANATPAVSCQTISVVAEPPPRSIQTNSHFWHLDLSEPEIVINTFLAAFDRSDYATMYYLLHGSTHAQVQRSLMYLQPNRLVRTPEKSIYDLRHHTADDNNYRNIVYYFDQVIASGRKHDTLIIDFQGTFNGLEYTSPESVVASVQGKSKSYKLYLKRTELNNWRIIKAEIPADNLVWPLDF